MDHSELVVVPLHDPMYSYLIRECAEMLSKEWKKSADLRERNLRESSDNFPYRVLFIEPFSPQLLGHAKITKVLNKPEALYVSSVIIKEEWRGQGLGKKFMQLIADHINKMGYKTLYLRTDVADFYIKCGYAKCDPVQEVANVKMEDRLAKLSAAYGSKSTGCSERIDRPSDQSMRCSDESVLPTAQIPSAPLAPKVPCESRKTLYNCVSEECGEFKCKFWMKKFLR